MSDPWEPTRRFFSALQELRESDPDPTLYTLKEVEMTAGRFVLVAGEDTYVTSFDTWEECEVAFESNGIRARMPAGHRLEDGETGRIWYPGDQYRREDAST